MTFWKSSNFKSAARKSGLELLEHVLLGSIVLVVGLGYGGVKAYLLKAPADPIGIILIRCLVLVALFVIAFGFHLFKKKWAFTYGLLELIAGGLLSIAAVDRAWDAPPYSEQKIAALVAGVYFMKRGIDTIAESKTDL